MRNDYGYQEKPMVNEGVERIAIAIFILTIIASFIFILFCPKKAEAAEIIDMHKIMMIESGGNPHLVEKWGGIGLYQITLPTLSEYNALNKVLIPKSSLFNADTNTTIAKWYLTKRIPQMLLRYKKTVNARNIIIAYNAGISYVAYNKKLPPTTIKYLKKYGV